MFHSNHLMAIGVDGHPLQQQQSITIKACKTDGMQSSTVEKKLDFDLQGSSNRDDKLWATNEVEAGVEEIVYGIDWCFCGCVTNRSVVTYVEKSEICLRRQRERWWKPLVDWCLSLSQLICHPLQICHRFLLLFLHPSSPKRSKKRSQWKLEVTKQECSWIV